MSWHHCHAWALASQHLHKLVCSRLPEEDLEVLPCRHRASRLRCRMSRREDGAPSSRQSAPPATPVGQHSRARARPPSSVESGHGTQSDKATGGEYPKGTHPIFIVQCHTGCWPHLAAVCKGQKALRQALARPNWTGTRGTSPRPHLQTVGGVIPDGGRRRGGYRRVRVRGWGAMG